MESCGDEQRRHRGYSGSCACTLFPPDPVLRSCGIPIPNGAPILLDEWYVDVRHPLTGQLLPTHLSCHVAVVQGLLWDRMRQEGWWNIELAKVLSLLLRKGLVIYRGHFDLDPDLAYRRAKFATLCFCSELAATLPKLTCSLCRKQLPVVAMSGFRICRGCAAASLVGLHVLTMCQ